MRNNYGGSQLLKKFGHPFFLLQAAYPDHDYLPWLFNPIPKNIFSNIDIRKKYVAWLVQTVGAKTADDLNLGHFRGNYGAPLLNQYHNSIPNILNSLKFEDIETESPLSAHSTVRKPHKFWVPLHQVPSSIVSP